MSQNDSKNADKSPGDSFNELKTMLIGYAKQETKDPLSALGKWVAFGLAGGLLVAIGLAYLAFGLLRMTQDLSWTDNGFSFLPYLFTVLVLGVGAALAAMAATKKFSDDQ